MTDRLWKAFGVKKSPIPSYHPMVMVYESLSTNFDSHIHMWKGTVLGKNTYSCCYSSMYICTELQDVLPQASLPMRSRLALILIVHMIPALQSSFYSGLSYFCEILNARLAQLTELVDANLAQSASQQQSFYRSNQTPVNLSCRQQVPLDNPCAGKLDPCWTGPWNVKELGGPSSVLLSRGGSEKLVHINRVQPLLTCDSKDQGVTSR